jgi:hypothetical protein
VRVALDHTAARLRNEVHGSVQGERRQAPSAVALLDLDAGDAVVGQSLGGGEILLAVMDAG